MMVFKLFRKKNSRFASDNEAWSAIVRGGVERNLGCEYFYNQYAVHLKTKFQSAGVSEADAEELLQEVFIKLVVHNQSFTIGGDLRKWIYAIAQNTLVSHLRKLSSIEKVISDVHENGKRRSFSELARIERFGMEDCVHQALQEYEQSHPQHASVLINFILENQRSKALAKQLEKSDGATREYLRQCRIKLRPFLERCNAFLEGY
jgi:RNA polymerase sigma factor (sigma-70 family)